MQVKQLNPQEILRHWPEIEPEIAKALKHSSGESSTYDIFTWLQNPNYAQCWVVFDDNNKPVNVTVTRINQYGQHTSLHIVTTTGNGWKAYKNSHHVIEDYARSIGAIRIEMYGRFGWDKILKKLTGRHGETYKPVYTVHSMSLKEL